MILNKSSHERGFGHGTIYKTKICDLEEGGRRNRSGKTVSKLFGFAPEGLKKASYLDTLDEAAWGAASETVPAPQPMSSTRIPASTCIVSIRCRAPSMTLL